MSDNEALQTRVDFLETSLRELTEKYNLLRHQLNTKSNDGRKKVDSGDRFLYNYAVNRKGPWQ
jgi:hypothetical protein